VSTLGAILSTAGGVFLIGLAGRDVFDALFHPEGKGTFARLISRGVWRIFRWRGSGPRLFPLAGPVALVVVIATWAALLIVGWTLIFWPHMPAGFRFDPGVAGSGDLLHSLNVSLVSLTTLGFGDVTPKADLLRLVVPLEALLGFGLLSASISWLLLIYPVLSRRRSLSYEIWLLRAAERDTGLAVDALEPEALESVYSELTSRLVAVERDLVSFPITYYFAEADPRFSLPAVAPHLLDLARRGCDEKRPDSVRLRANLLLEVVDDLARTTADRFHRGSVDTIDEALSAYARDHLRDD
jgi:hypothetical protein